MNRKAKSIQRSMLLLEAITRDMTRLHQNLERILAELSKPDPKPRGKCKHPSYAKERKSITPRKPKYDFTSFKVGDSILVPYTNYPGLTRSKVQQRVNTPMQKWKARHQPTWKFRTAQETDGIRCERIA